MAGRGRTKTRPQMLPIMQTDYFLDKACVFTRSGESFSVGLRRAKTTEADVWKIG